MGASTQRRGSPRQALPLCDRPTEEAHIEERCRWCTLLAQFSQYCLTYDQFADVHIPTRTGTTQMLQYRARQQYTRRPYIGQLAH